MSYIHQFVDKYLNEQFIAIGNEQKEIRGLYRYYYFMKLRTYNKNLEKL